MFDQFDQGPCLTSSTTATSARAGRVIVHMSSNSLTILMFEQFDQCARRRSQSVQPAESRQRAREREGGGMKPVCVCVRERERERERGRERERERGERERERADNGKSTPAHHCV